MSENKIKTKVKKRTSSMASYGDENAVKRLKQYDVNKNNCNSLVKTVLKERDLNKDQSCYKEFKLDIKPSQSTNNESRIKTADSTSATLDAISEEIENCRELHVTSTPTEVEIQPSKSIEVTSNGGCTPEKGISPTAVDVLRRPASKVRKVLLLLIFYLH